MNQVLISEQSGNLICSFLDCSLMVAPQQVPSLRRALSFVFRARQGFPDHFISFESVEALKLWLTYF